MKNIIRIVAIVALAPVAYSDPNPTPGAQRAEKCANSTDCPGKLGLVGLTVDAADNRAPVVVGTNDTRMPPTPAAGGTGKVLYDTGTVIGEAGPGTTTTVLHGNAAGAPTYAAASLTADVSGTLPIANGGTNSAAALGGSTALVVSSGTALVVGPQGTTTTVLHGAAAGNPTYAAVAAADIAPSVLNSVQAATTANATSTGGLMIMHRVDYTPAVVNVTITEKERIVDAMCVPSAAQAGGTIQISNLAANITDAMVSAVIGTVARAGTISAANQDIAAAGTLRFTPAGAATAGTCYVTALKVP